jgi:hypothetical protein
VTERTLTPAEVKEVGRVQRLKPKETDFIGKPGYRRTYRPDGKYDWSYEFKANDNGKVTNEAREFGERLLPFQRADTERQSRLQSKVEKVRLKDQNGNTHYLDAALAGVGCPEGWSHSWRPRGATVERGVTGMLWRRAPKGWEPLGVRCLGVPLSGRATVSPRGIQRDPDGNPWRHVMGKWRAL